MTDEQKLIRRMLGGDEQAFEAFFNAYFARVYRFALPRLNGDADATREVVQSTLAKAMRHIADFRGESALFTWICQICRREAVDHIRARRRHTRNVVLSMTGRNCARRSRPSRRRGVRSREVYGAPRRPRWRVVLDRLPANYGNALEWKYMEGSSVEEIGERLGIGTVAAQSLLARARTSFREALEQVFGAEAADIAAGLGA
jgi:RNA polymerase sigma-70 factor (ECF subfamily)